MSSPAVCVIFNPAAGKGRGRDRLNKLHRVLGGQGLFRPTQHPGHAEELALQAAQDGCAIVAAAGGDGTAHEVANGILRSERPDVIFAVVPVGSANDYAYSLGLDAEWWLHPDERIAPRPVDVGVVQSGERRRYFINGLGLGFNGAVTLESRKIKRLQGLALYGLALLRTLCFHFDQPCVTLRFDDGPASSGPTLALSLAIGQREGNFVVAPNAVMDDGFFEYIHGRALSRFDLLRFVPGLAVGRLPANHPQVGLGRCRKVEVACERPLLVHIDGEFFCRVEDECREIAIECLPRRLLAFSRLSQSNAAAQSSCSYGDGASAP